MPPPRSVEEWARRQAQNVELPSCTCDQLPDDGQFHAFCTNHARMAKAIERSAIAYAAEQVAQARAEEREECAKIADAEAWEYNMGEFELHGAKACRKVAAAIRRRAVNASKA